MDQLPVTAEQNTELVHLAENLNEKMKSSGASGAEIAFGLGCGIGLIPVVGTVIILLVFGIINFIPGLLLLVMGMMALAGISVLLANVARSNAHKRIYREGEPEITQFLSRNHLSREAFDTLAYQSLSADAPLQTFLSPVIVESQEPNE